MFRTTRTLLCALCLIALGLAAVPAFAQAPPPGPAVVISAIKLIRTVTVVGFGETLAEAEANGVAELEDRYRVLSYTTSNPLCTEIVLDPIGHPNDTITLCSIEVEGKVIPKVFWVRP